MRVQLTIRLFAHFRDGRFREAAREVASGTTVGELADALHISRDEVGVVLVNGRHAELDHATRPADVVSIFPLVGGG